MTASNITVSVRFFARLREALDTDQLSMELPTGSNAGQVLETLARRGGEWSQLTGGTPLMIAVNQAMARPSTPLNNNDEVAVFPPVTGG
ncbi:molybdopterin converting factor subunit 1 [Marinobacter changyiensis]|uniref:molybdopterin converting factor subunit 1 n=1 Tax=Marinobacter changyiensis TaxID=2604091 RepID=UPI0012650BB4|nr:molybdopterin converting factor subunit 1 [Marinobacter changyiensis]